MGEEKASTGGLKISQPPSRDQVMPAETDLALTIIGRRTGWLADNEFVYLPFAQFEHMRYLYRTSWKCA